MTAKDNLNWHQSWLAIENHCKIVVQYVVEIDIQTKHAALVCYITICIQGVAKEV